MSTIPNTSEQRPCWFVGAAFGGYDDQTDRFLEEGVWQNGYRDRYLDQVNSMRPGDRIAIKSTFTQRHNLPFPIPHGKIASAMYIKAIGTVRQNVGDGRHVRVDWTRFEHPRPWYFYTYQRTVWEVWPGRGTLPWAADALISFAFEDKPQDYVSFLEQWGWLDNKPVDINGGKDPPIPMPPPYSIESIVDEGCFISSSRLEEVLEHFRLKKNLILQGPPGTGKTWLARKLAFALIGHKDAQKVHAVQFHPNLSYEDFVRGWRPSGEGRLDLVDGSFLEMIGAARTDLDSEYVMVIEEINRGNPAQVFGELLTLLEADKRNESEALALSYRKYDGERVYIPENVYVIGTMNIADRSLALVDLAFRRRFAFEELEPTFGQPWRHWVSQNCDIDAQFLAAIEERLGNLNIQIANDRNLGPQFRVGHSYVTPSAVVLDPLAWFTRVVEREIGPLLDEYWFDSPEAAQQAKSALLQGLH